MGRNHLGSRLGFILLSAGCAIGVGNVWKFPWLVGQNGGGAFVLVYVIFLILLGLPIMTMEFAIGRKAQKSPVLMYQELVPEKKAWYLHGAACFIGNIILMMFYTMVTGWMFYYFVMTAMGKFVGLGSEEVGAVFNNLCASPMTLVGYTVAVCIIGFFILSFSLKAGLERVVKVMMVALLVIMLVIAFNGLTLSGATKGLAFYLVPDLSKINIDVVIAAMNQAFFTLSLGIGSMAIFGSYIDKNRSLLGESINVVILDTFVAIMSGFIIFPACFTYNVEPTAGPALIFVTLPNIFTNMPLGRVWGSLFFLFMSFAAFSTVLAVFENILACVRDLTGWSRKNISIVCCIGIIVLAIPCCLGFNLWSSIQPLGEGTGIMDLEDFIVSNCLLPIGSLIIVIFCTNKFGLGWDTFIEEANAGVGVKMKNWMYGYCKFVLPVIVAVLIFLGIKQYITLKDVSVYVIVFVIAYVVTNIVLYNDKKARQSK